MKLYYMPGACPLATQIVLEWIGKPYDTELVPREDLKKPAFLALNPVGSVPVLIDGDLTLTQSAAILEYLAELNPELDLLGGSVRERAETRRWLGFCNADLHKTFGVLFTVKTYSDDESVQKQIASKTSAKLVSLFEIMDKQLEGKQWITGKRSVADPYLYVLLRWAHGKELDIGRLQNLERFYQHMQGQPAVQAAVKAQGLS